MAENFAFDWDSEIQNDGASFELLPEGDYSFVVVGMERGSYNGNDKMPACPMATLTLDVKDAAGNAGQVEDRLYLCSSNEWKLCQFFTAIGQRQHGERLKPNWQKVVGSRGTLQLAQTKSRTSDNKFNNVKKYYEAQAKPAAKTWEAGRF